MTATATQLKRLVFAWLAVTMLIMSVACTKKDGGSPQAPPAPTPAKPAATPTPKPTGKARKELDNNSGKSAQDKETDGEDIPSREEPPPSGVSDGELLTDPTGLKPDEIFAKTEKQGPSAPGIPADVESSEALFFSGAGQDLLHEQISAQLDDAKTDREFASRIGLSTFVVDFNSRRAHATVTILDKQGNRQQFDFKGVLDNQARLRGGDLRTGSGLAFEAVCMDVNGGCNTVHMQIRKSGRGGVKTAHVIARHTTAYIYSEGNEPGASNNPEYDVLMNAFVNTANSPSRSDIVQALSFWTSEAINGRSEFAVSMVLGTDPYSPRAQQVFALTGPLVKPAQSTDMNLVIARPTGLDSVGGRRVQMQGRIMDTIRELRLVKNDGRGNLQFDITVRKGSAEANEDTIRLTIARIHEQTRSPSLR